MKKKALKKKSDGVTSTIRAKSVGYSKDVLVKIFDRISAGDSLHKICATEGMPSRKSFFQWVAEDVEARKTKKNATGESILEQYNMAVAMRTDYHAEQIIEIADDGLNDTYVDNDGQPRVDHDHIQRSRLRVDARKWVASKLLPKKYGDRLDTTLSAPDGGPVQVERIERVIVDAGKK